jgi:hypothetical protein
MFQDKELHYSGWQTDKIFRLFKKDKAHYTTERLVHEKLTVDGEIGKLKNKLIHYSYTDFESYKRKWRATGNSRPGSFPERCSPEFIKCLFASRVQVSLYVSGEARFSRR